MQPFVKSASVVLQSALSANTMKVCWNVCYAFGKMLKNTELVQSNVIQLVSQTFINFHLKQENHC